MAESTGKAGTGLLPVADESLGDPAVYGEDRAFVYIRFGQADSTTLDRRVDALRQAGHPVVGDELYGSGDEGEAPLGLRAVRLAYADPFTRRPVKIRARFEEFVREFGFELPRLPF